jgi:RNA polymerase primary sigma factor
MTSAIPHHTIARRDSHAPFDDLKYVFARAGTRLLSPSEETRLAQQMWQGRRRLAVAAAHRRAGVSRPLPDVAPHLTALTPSLSKRLRRAEEEARGLPERRGGSELTELIEAELGRIDAARQELLQRNLRLVAWMAKGFLGKGLDLLDLFQEGCIALLWSIDRFDPARGTRLSTFASYAVRLGLVRALAERGRMVRVPNYRLREVVETHAALAKLRNRLGREPSLTELAKETGLDPENLEQLVAAVRPTVSIDAPVGGTELYLSESLVDPSQRSPFDAAASAEAEQLAVRALARLPERERRIMSMRYGLGDSEERSYEDIGRSLGLSRERTRQLEIAARDKLRHLMQSDRS